MKPPMVVMAGPLPPTVGGMASVLGALAASTLAQRVDLRLFETGKTTPPGRPLVVGIAARLRLMRDWWRLLGERPGAVAHIHTCSGLTYFLDGTLLVLARLRGLPVVLHVHGAQFDKFLDSLDPLRLGLARWFARRAHVVIVLSDEWRQRLVARLPGAQVRVVANGVPGAGVAPVATARTTAFVFLGNLGRRKGVHVLIDAAQRARQPWTISLAGGEDEPGFMDWARTEIDRHGLTSRLRLLGPVVGEDKAMLLREADGFVLPSLAEGLPMALLEAMASGLPVVVTRVGAMPEVVRDGQEGLLVPAGDAQALADALDRMACEPAARVRMGQSAREVCEQRFGIERMVDALMTTYRQLPGRPVP
jgi:glycosyltransferase involved in cell wall biosynthesis